MKYPIKKYSKDAYTIGSDGRPWNTFWSTKGIASEFIGYLPAVLGETKNRKVVLYARVSKPPQATNGNLRDQKNEAQEMLRKLGCTVIGIFSEVQHSSIFNEHRYQLEAAIDCALEQGAILVALSRDRFLRCDSSSPSRPRMEPPVIMEYKRFKLLTNGVCVATLFHPDEDASAHSGRIKRGQKAKRNKGGRPRKEVSDAGFMKRRAEKFMPMAIRFKRCGLSYVEIVNHIRDAYPEWPTPTAKTVFNWLKNRM